MLEIKFQVFTEDWKGVKKCFDGYSLYLLEEIPLSFGKPKDGRWYKVAFTNSEGDKETVVVDRDKIRMFTGLKDKNGTEIYEGDIIRDLDVEETENIIKLKLRIFTVKWNNAIHGFLRFDNQIGFFKGRIGLYDEDLSDIEVIGNIYENPELLDGEFK